MCSVGATEHNLTNWDISNPKQVDFVSILSRLLFTNLSQLCSISRSEKTMLPLLRNALLTVAQRATRQMNLVNSFHLLAKQTTANLPHSLPTLERNVLIPSVPNLVQSCGFKVMRRVRRRCKDCYFVRREERMYVICKTHPRHKQMSVVPDVKNTWILSHATQSKVRPW